jgi:hypothetical protein
VPCELGQLVAEPLALLQRVQRRDRAAGVGERVSERHRIAGGSGDLDRLRRQPPTALGVPGVGEPAGQQGEHLGPPWIVIREGSRRGLERVYALPVHLSHELAGHSP